MFKTNYRAGDAGKSAETLVETLLTCDFWPAAQWTDVWRSKIPMLNSLVPVKVFDAFQRLQCLCLFTCLFESQLNCTPKKAVCSCSFLSCISFFQMLRLIRFSAVLEVLILSFALICAEKLTLRMKYGVSSSKHKRPEFERLQDIIEAKRQESNKTLQTVIIPSK